MVLCNVLMFSFSLLHINIISDPPPRSLHTVVQSVRGKAGLGWRDGKQMFNKITRQKRARERH